MIDETSLIEAVQIEIPVWIAVISSILTHESVRLIFLCSGQALERPRWSFLYWRIIPAQKAGIRRICDTIGSAD
jgi:hypothetical protein